MDQNTPRGMLSFQDLIDTAAGRLADDPAVGLDARDRNAAIGKLREVAAFVVGAPRVPPYKQAPFAPTTPGGSRPESAPAERHAIHIPGSASDQECALGRCPG